MPQPHLWLWWTLCFKSTLDTLCASVYEWNFGLFHIQNKTLGALKDYIWNHENEAIVCQNEQMLILCIDANDLAIGAMLM
jgi:hypothetical protein